MKKRSKVSKLVRTAPKRIFLQIADEDYSGESFPRPYGEEITWCETSCVSCEVEYTRADLAAEQREKLLEMLEQLCTCPQSVDQATIPAAGIDAAPDQVIVVLSVSLTRLREARAAIALAQGDAA